MFTLSEVLDDGPKPHRKYALRFIFIHEGETGSSSAQNPKGHYYGYVRNFFLNRWLKLDDDVISIIDDEVVMNDAVINATGVYYVDKDSIEYSRCYELDEPVVRKDQVTNRFSKKSDKESEDSPADDGVKKLASPIEGTERTTTSPSEGIEGMNKSENDEVTKGRDEPKESPKEDNVPMETSPYPKTGADLSELPSDDGDEKKSTSPIEPIEGITESGEDEVTKDRVEPNELPPGENLGMETLSESKDTVEQEESRTEENGGMEKSPSDDGDEKSTSPMERTEGITESGEDEVTKDSVGRETSSHTKTGADLPKKPSIPGESPSDHAEDQHDGSEKSSSKDEPTDDEDRGIEGMTKSGKDEVTKGRVEPKELPKEDNVPMETSPNPKLGADLSELPSDDGDEKKSTSPMERIEGITESGEDEVTKDRVEPKELLSGEIGGMETSSESKDRVEQGTEESPSDDGDEKKSTSPMERTEGITESGEDEVTKDSVGMETSSYTQSLSEKPSFPGESPSDVADHQHVGSEKSSSKDEPSEDEDRGEPENAETLSVPRIEPYEAGTLLLRDIEDTWYAGEIITALPTHHPDQPAYLVTFSGLIDREKMVHADVSSIIVKSDPCPPAFPDGWIIKKGMDVFVHMNKADHPATIHSLVPLYDGFFDTEYICVTWACNGEKDNVKISDVQPMSAVSKRRKPRKRSRINSEYKKNSLHLGSSQERVKRRLLDLNDPRNLLCGLSKECRAFLDCLNRNNRKPKSRRKKRKRVNEGCEGETLRDDFRSFQYDKTLTTPFSRFLSITIPTTTYDESSRMSKLKSILPTDADPYPFTKLAQCLALMSYAYEFSDGSYGSDTVVWAPLQSFLDLNLEADIRLTCYSQMSITVLYIPSFHMNEAILRLACDILGLESSSSLINSMTTELLMVVHGPLFENNESVIRFVNSGYINFIQSYEIIQCFAFQVELDPTDSKIRGFTSNTAKCVVESNSLPRFLECLAMYLSMIIEPEKNSGFTQIPPSPYRSSTVDFMHNFFKERTQPSYSTVWENKDFLLHRKLIFDTETLVTKINLGPDITADAIDIGVVLMNCYYFCGKHERYRKNNKWAIGNATIESVCASSMIIYVHPISNKFRLRCKCCEMDCHNPEHGDFDSLRDALYQVPVVSVIHRLVKPLSLVSRGLIEPSTAMTSQSEKVVGRDFQPSIDTQPHPRLRIIHFPALESDKTVTACRPDKSRPDSVLGDDMILLSSVFVDVGEGNAVEMLKTWTDILNNIFWDHSDLFIKEMSELELKLSNPSDGDPRFKTPTPEKILFLEDVKTVKDENWKSEVVYFQSILAEKATSITKVDWRDSRLPREVPKDMLLIISEEDIDRLNHILKSQENQFQFFHQFGLLEPYLSVAEAGSDGAHTYRKIPSVAHQFAFQCSNLCVNVFNQVGRNEKVDSSVLFVITSELDTKVLRKIQSSQYSKHIDSYLTTSSVPGRKGKQLVSWVADKEIEALLEIEPNFLDGLTHLKETLLSDRLRKSLRDYSKQINENYSDIKRIRLDSLHPYKATLTRTRDPNFTEHMGFAQCQYAVSIAYFEDSIPHLRAFERMTNVSFLTNTVTQVLQSVENRAIITYEPEANDETLTKSPATAEAAKSKLGAMNDDVSSESPATTKPTQRTEMSTRKSGRLKKKKDDEISGTYSAPPWRNIGIIIPPSGIGCSIKKGEVPSCIPSSSTLPIDITLENWNCVLGNFINLLHYINQIGYGIEAKLSTMSLTGRESLTNIRGVLRSYGYLTFTVPVFKSFEQLESMVRLFRLPIIANFRIQVLGRSYEHVIGIAPRKMESGSIEFDLIDGGHPMKRAIPFNYHSFVWSCGADATLEHALAFVPSPRLVHHMFFRGYKHKPGHVVSLTSNKTIFPLLMKEEGIRTHYEEAMRWNTCNRSMNDLKVLAIDIKKK
jgi:hypothetical protein